MSDLLRPCVLVAALLSIGQAHAAEPVHLEQGDWVLQCDNTRRCSAVGYQAESERERAGLAAVRIGREAGPAGPAQVEVQALPPASNRRSRGPLKLQSGAMTVDGLSGVPARVPPDQAERLVQAMLGSGELRLAAGAHRWSISFDGFRQVLARMDEAQQRQGTVAAWVLVGTRPADGIPGPDPVPVIRATLPVPAVAADARLTRAIFGELNPDDTDVCGPALESHRQLSVRRLSVDTVLVAAPCLNGVYDGDRHWLARVHAPHQPKFLEGIEGRFDPRRGTITEQHKLVGYGTCYLYRQWQLTPAGFALASERSDTMCRGFPDGAWELPVVVSRVLPPSSNSFFSNRKRAS